MYSHNNSHQHQPQYFLPLSSSFPSDASIQLLDSMIVDIPTPLRVSRLQGQQRNYNDKAQSHRPQNRRYIPRLEVEQPRRPDEDQNPRRPRRGRVTQSVSPTVSPLSTMNICTSLKGHRSRPRHEVFSMLDYLTMSQLEEIWRKQDVYNDYVDMPQKLPYLMPTSDDTREISPCRGGHRDPVSHAAGHSTITERQVVR